MIVHKLLPDGGFVAGDTESRATCYAYPTSIHANMARRAPDKAAREMLTDGWRGFPDIVARYDAGNWAMLESAALTT